MQGTAVKQMLIPGLWLVIALGASAAEIHQWKDSEGQMHFGDRPPVDVKSEVVRVKPNVYQSPTVEPLASDFKTDRSVVMYSASWCGYCKRARRYLEDKGIAYTEYDVETSEKGQEDYRRLNAHGVPIILIGQKRMNGFSAAAFEALFKGN